MLGNNNNNSHNQITLNEKSEFDDVLEEMVSSNYGEHNILVYPNKSTIRDIYSSYCKSSLGYNNNNNGNTVDEMVLLIPFYETVEGVKYTLRKRAGIDTEKHEKDGSLAIVDSFEAYSRQPNDNTYTIVPLFKLLLQHAQIFGKKGISVISDLGLFFYQFQQIEELIKYETSFPQKKDLKCKAFCSYRKDYFDMLTEHQKQSLLSHHAKNLVVLNAAQ